MTTSLLSAAPPSALSPASPIATPRPAPPIATPRPAPPAVPNSRAPVRTAALTRFTAAGMLAALDAHAAGRLGSDRLCWELSVRLEQLGSLHAPAPTLTRLRWRHRALEQSHPGPVDREPSPEQRQAFAAALTDLRTVLAGIVR